jgi:pimeloyl-ACP methyl ester carboxylesterase
MMRYLRLRGAACLIAAIALTAVCSTAAFASQHVDGTLGDGSLYVIDVPQPWDGDLIVYAHGIVDPSAPIALPTTQDAFAVLRDAWLAQGKAVAASSYSENGYALKDGAQHTRQLTGLFTDRFGRPDRVYLVGHSLGAIAALMLAEQHPLQYDGALVMCGFVGGGLVETAYAANARILFDYFFPSVVPGDAFNIPPGLLYAPGSPLFSRVYNALVAGLFSPSQPTLQFGLTARLPFRNPNELIASALTVIGFNLRFTNDILDRTHGGLPFENTETVYSGSFDDPAVNAGVQRFSSSPSAINYMSQYYTPSGMLGIPVLTLHTTVDPVAPITQEQTYGDRVAANGGAHLLTQQYVSRYGHCAFTAEETLNAFSSLVAWVKTGVKPTSGDVTIP